MNAKTRLYIGSIGLTIALLVSLTACAEHDNSLVSTSTPEGAVTLENEGQVCFYPISPTQLRASISAGCFPSYCTKVFERVGDMQVNTDEFVIQLHSRFVARSIAGTPNASGQVRACAADCGGAGYLDFETEELGEGTYLVRLGEEDIGTLNVPFWPNHVCFDNYKRPTPLPTATYAGPTATPWPSPLEYTSPLPTPSSP